MIGGSWQAARIDEVWAGWVATGRGASIAIGGDHFTAALGAQGTTRSAG